MILAERHIIKRSHVHFQELDNVCFLSKNLYNASLYAVRQHFFTTKEYLSYVSNCKTFQDGNQPDYRALPTKVAQQTMKMVEQNFKSFFGLLSKKGKGDYGYKLKIPKYLDKKGRYITTYTNQAISRAWLRKGFINLSGTGVYIPTKVKEVTQVRVIPKPYHIVVEVLYEVDEKPLKEPSGRYCSVDLGLNNLATVGSNVIKSIIVNGRPLKSINQYYNKEKAKVQSKLERTEKRKTSKKLHRLTSKRNNKVDDYLHKSSRLIVNHLVSNNIDTLVIGQNKEWKQDINIGKQNNQNFVTIPHSRFIQLLKYKCKMEGINVVTTEESYTSKCSFMDNEPIRKHSEYKGKRVKRGLFKTQEKKLINADLNGALNILKKVVGEFQYPIEVCSTPLVLTIK